MGRADHWPSLLMSHTIGQCSCTRRKRNEAVATDNNVVLQAEVGGTEAIVA